MQSRRLSIQGWSAVPIPPRPSSPPVGLPKKACVAQSADYRARSMPEICRSPLSPSERQQADLTFHLLCTPYKWFCCTNNGQIFTSIDSDNTATYKPDTCLNQVRTILTDGPTCLTRTLQSLRHRPESDLKGEAKSGSPSFRTAANHRRLSGPADKRICRATHLIG